VVFDVDQIFPCPCRLGIRGAPARASSVRMAADSVLSHGERNGQEDNADPSVDEGRGPHAEVAHSKMVIARKLNRSVDAIYGLASRFGVMLGGDRGRKETW